MSYANFIIPKGVTEAEDEDEFEAEYKRSKLIAGLLRGEVPLGIGDSEQEQWNEAPVGTLVVINFLRAVRAVVRGLDRVATALNYVFSQKWCGNRADYTPTGATAYKFVKFNAWTYKGSDLLWASFLKDLWEAVEDRFGKKVVRYHRAGVALVNERNESFRALSPEEKARKRKQALLMVRARFYLSIFVFLVVTGVSWAVTIPLCFSPEKPCGQVGNEFKGGVIGAIVASVLSFVPLLAYGK